MKIVFVCTGNICRSPTAEAVMVHILKEAGLYGRVLVDSCGTVDYHVGEAPDPRAIAVAESNGINMNDLRARQINGDDLIEADLLLAMDLGHVAQLQTIVPPKSKVRIDLFLGYAGMSHMREVPDPYYGTVEDFKRVYHLVEQGAQQMLPRLRNELRKR